MPAGAPVAVVFVVSVVVSEEVAVVSLSETVVSVSFETVVVSVVSVVVSTVVAVVSAGYTVISLSSVSKPLDAVSAITPGCFAVSVALLPFPSTLRISGSEDAQSKSLLMME